MNSIRDGYKFDEFGDIVNVDVFIVWGPPASGKTTYVKEHMEEGDLIVDLDNIKQAISLSKKTECPINLLETALKIRDLLYKIIENRQISCKNVWIIAGLPRWNDRQRLKEKLNPTEMIFIEATKEKCIEQSLKDTARKDKMLQARVIEKWFSLYE